MRLFPLFFVLPNFSLIDVALILRWLCSGDVKILAFSDSGELLASGGEESAVYIVRLPTQLLPVLLNLQLMLLLSDHLHSFPLRTKRLSPRCLRTDRSARWPGRQNSTFVLLPSLHRIKPTLTNSGSSLSVDPGIFNDGPTEHGRIPHPFAGCQSLMHTCTERTLLL